MNTQGQCILLVEDDPNDVFFLQYAFEKCGITHPLVVVGDGQQAVDYLGGRGAFTNRDRFPLPCLVLLDLNLPLMPGLEVLKWIRKQRELIGLPVIILSSSQDERDVSQSYKLGACSFLVKPISMDQRVRMAQAIKDYWLDMNQIPFSSRPRPARKNSRK